MTGPRPRPPGGGRLRWWDIPAGAAWLLILAARGFVADVWQELVRDVRRQSRAVELWAATVTGVTLGSCVVQLRPVWMPGWSAMLLGVAISSLAMSIGALGGHLHYRWLARQSAARAATFLCGEEFYNCDDSTDDAPHRCELPPHDTGQHHCQCGVWGDC